MRKPFRPNGDKRGTSIEDKDDANYARQKDRRADLLMRMRQKVQGTPPQSSQQ